MIGADKPYADMDVKVVIIEDEPHIRVIVRRLLNQMGITNVYEAADGNAGFKELVRVRPHFVICDIHMDGLDGMTFLKRMRALSNKSVSTLPIIFLTADQDSDTRASAARYGVSAYLTKPVSYNDLLEQVRKVAGF